MEIAHLYVLKASTTKKAVNLLFTTQLCISKNICITRIKQKTRAGSSRDGILHGGSMKKPIITPTANQTNSNLTRRVVK